MPKRVSQPAGKTIRKLSDLTPDRRNANAHTERGVGMLEHSLRTLGAGRSIVVDRDGHVIAGNATLERAVELGLGVQVVKTRGDQLVVVQREDLDLNDPKARELAIADNRVAEVDLSWSPAVLTALQADGLDLKPWFFPDELAEILGEDGPKDGLTDPDAVPELRATSIQPGDLFELGAHRLLCGDCTKPADVARLMGDVKIDCLLIDPPYCSGGFQESSKSSGSVGTTEKKRLATRKVANDTLSTRGYQALLKSAIGNIDAALLYIFTDWRMWLNLFDVVESRGYGVRNMIVWDKGSPGMGSGWRTQHELIMFGTKVSPGFDNHKAQGNVIAAKRTGNEHHATQKPVDLLVKVLNVTDMATTICDAFTGSGSTLIASEQAGRQFFGIELEPRHAQTTIDRWEAFTGLKATKVGELVQA